LDVGFGNPDFVTHAHSFGAKGYRIDKADDLLPALHRTLAENSPALHDASASLLPALADLRKVGVHIATAVGLEAQRAGMAPKTTEEELRQRVMATQWTPAYPSFAIAKM